MAQKKYIIFDFGASNGRAVVAKFDGSRFSMDVMHRFDNRPVYASGILYWDILRLYSELKNGLLQSLKMHKDVSSLGIDTWGVDFGFIDHNGRLLANPHHYRDEARINTEKDLYKLISKDEIFELTGGLILPIMSIFHMYWLKKSASSQLLHADKYLMMPDLFNYFLTGNVFNEYTEATTSIMYDQKNNKWSQQILDLLQIPSTLFPEIIKPGNIAGKIQKNVCDELEIHPLNVVAPASHDTASAVTGIPVVDKTKNWAFVSMGTWLVAGQETNKPIITMDVFKSGYANEGGVEGSNLLVKNITGLWIIQQCMERWRKDKDKNMEWSEIDKLYPTTKPFKCLIDVDDPAFSMPCADMSKVLQKYCKDTNQAIPEGIGEISRCFYESLTFKIKYNLDLLEKITNKKIELLHLVGGGTNNRLICQWISDIIGVPVIAGPTETTSVGNLIMQLKADKQINNLSEGRSISLASSDTRKYEPKESQIWQDAYGHYLSVLKK